MASILVPAWHTARHLSVVQSRQTIGARGTALWQRLYIDVILLVLAGLVFWRTASTGYQVVLAPEGVAATSVDYTAFLAPAFLWVGMGLLTLRLSAFVLTKGRGILSVMIAPFAGPLATPVTASLARQNRRVACGVALTVLAFAFAASTAIFNTTYQGQTLVDAELSNGADVTVTGTTFAPAGQQIAALSALPGVTHAASMQHRFAYVGTDLQDLYGIDATTIGKAMDMANAYFQNGDAAATLATLAKTPAAVLVSDETVKDYQLNQGDTLNLRLQGADHQFHVIPFKFAGVVREFPTAPRDSFIIANAANVAKMTGLDASEVVLLRTNGDLSTVKAEAQNATKSMPGVKVTSLADATHIIGSSLTAVDLNGLTRLELAFAMLMVAGAGGLVLALGLADRRRSFAILAALGARAGQLAPFVWVEAAVIFVGGAVIGMATGTLVATILVKVLQGVFDPPPDVLAIPLPYLGTALVVGFIAITLAVLNALREVQIAPMQRLKELQ